MASIFDGLSLADDAPLPAAPVPPPVPPLGPPGRRIDDVSATRKAIYDSVLSSFRGLVPATNTRYSLRLDNLDYEDPDEVSLKDQKAAILHGRTVSRRLRGDWVLADTDGLEVERKRATVAQVPYLTPRGTYIVNGSEYTLANQLRLRPGVFTRRKENGEVESHLNTLPGQGMSHRYLLDPETGRFQAQFGQAKLPLLPILRAVGATDDELRASWGDELLSANLKKDDPKGLDQVYAKLLPRGDQRIDAVAKRQAVAAYMAKMGFDPAVNARTLGSPYAALSKDAMLSTTAKLLAVSRGEAEPDDRDHLANQMFLGAEDLYAERAKRAGPALSRLLWQATYSKSLRRVQPNALTSQVQGALLDSGLGNPLEEVNAADVYDQLSRVTRLGTGGISSLDSIPLDSRSVQPSHFGYIDPIRTPESLKAGVDGRMTADVRKGDNGVLYSRFKDRTGNDQWLTPEQVAGSPVALPGELEKDDKYVAAVRGGRVDMVDRDEVTHELPTFDGLFSGVANLVPFRTGNKGQRLAMGSRFITQALPLIGAEAPLVRSAGPGGVSYDEMYGDRFGAVRAETDGRVQSVDKDGVTVKYADGRTETHQLYNTQPYNRKTMINSTSLVQPGDAVKPGQLLAHSNFTDDTGTLALGRNLRTAYLPYKGLAYEDAMVISESAAKKLTSQHLYQHETEFDADAKRGKKAYVSIFPARFDRRVLDAMDDDGAVQPGTVVQPGDPLVLAASPRELTHKQVHSAHKGTFRDQSDTWEHHVPGTVTDVAKTKKGIVVTVVSHMPMVEADKVSGRYGDKGTVSKIVPDEHMPQDAEGRPFELILNPLGIISRANPGQVYEALLGKVAAKTGKPFTIPDIGGKGDWTEMVQAELTKHGLSDTETVVDPTTGRKIPGVLTGVRYAYKLLHTSESKDQGRGLGAYTADDVPAKTGGADGSSKRLALMDSHALLSSGATEVLRDAKLIRGQKNQQYWSDFMAGNRPGTPDVPFVYRKFVERLRGSGINVVRDGTKSHLYALTNDDVDDLAGDRELKNADTVNWEDGLKPIPGGLFDPALTGGHGAAGRWSFIRLTEPMPSPVMEEPIKRVLGLTGPRFEAVLAGKEKLGELTGPRAIQAALTAVDMDQAIAQARADVKSGRAGVRDAAVRRLGFLAGARKSGIHPKQWMWSKLPVLPPAFRPVSMMQRTGSPLVADANYGYREVFEANANLSELKDRVADVGAERSALYGAMKAVVGLGDPVQPKNQERQVRGLLQHVFGWNPKQGTVQQQLLGGGTDMVGRAVAVPDPDLSLDEVGLPEARAWTVYSPFVVRRLVRDGVPRLQAMQYAKDRTPLALKALLAEMDTRPVIVTRAPVLHRYGELAFMPKLVKGDSIHTNPSIVQGYGLDYDGDQHVGSVLVSIPSGIDGVCESITVEGGSTASYASHLMPFSANLGIPTLDDGHALHVFNLEDFPHGAHTCVSQGRFGSVDWYHVPPGIKVLAYDETTGAAKWADVTIWSRHTGCPVEIVELRSGRQIVTDDDPRAVYGIPAGELALTRTTPTDALARRFLVPRIVAIAETDTPVREVRMGSDTGTGHHRRANLKDVAELTHSFGYLLGALAGDGWVAGNSRGVSELKDVVLAGITKAVVDKADAAIAELFVTAPPRKCSVVSTESYGQSERHTWTSIELAEFVAPMIGRGAANKHLPPWFLSAPRECREGLFAGLMDTDGSIAVSGAKKKPQLMANYSSNSLRLVRETQLLAMSIDIRGRITASKTPAGNVCWMLSFSNLDVAKWNGRGMTHPAKLLALTKAKPSETGSGAVRHDLVPLSFALAKALRLAVYKGKTKTGPWESPQQNSAYSALTAACKTGHAPRQTVRFSLAFRPAFTHPDLDACRRIVDNVAVTWEPVVAVEKTGVTETGYDLTVPGYETFASADGVILSNTMNYHVPASDEARDEALAKLLPSRNLLSVKSFKADNFVPRQEYLAGLHAASTKRDPLKTRRTFATTAAAVRAYYNGELDVDTPVEILDQPANKDKK